MRTVVLAQNTQIVKIVVLFSIFFIDFYAIFKYDCIAMLLESAFIKRRK